MKTFHIDVKVVGFSQVSVQAISLEEAEELARDKVSDYTVEELRWKTMSCTELNGD